MNNKNKKLPRCVHKLSDGTCELYGKKVDKTLCQRWRCRSFDELKTTPEPEEEAKPQKVWKEEYNHTRQSRTHTSSDVKARYNAKVYDRLTVTLPKGSGDLLRQRAAAQGLSLNKLLITAIVAHFPDCVTYDGGGGAISLADIWRRL